MIEMSKSKWIASMTACALVGSVAGSVGLSFADNFASTSTVLEEGVIVPYDGYLMLDSAPVNAAAQNLRFSLYESPTGGTAQWVETQVASVNGGRFSVALGKGTKVSSSPANADFTDVILDAEKLYIGIEVDDGNGTFIELAGRQAIEAAPFAAWAAKSADFEVARDLTVQRNTQLQGGLGVTGNAQIGGGLGVVGAVTASSTIDVSGQVTAREFDGAIAPRYQAWNAQVTGDGGAAIYNDDGIYKALMVVGNNSAGSQRQIDLYDDVFINSDLSVSNTASVGGRLTASSGIILGQDQSITGLDTLQGFNDLKLSGDAHGNADLRIDANGDITVSGNMTGGFKYTSEYTRNVNGDRAMIASSSGMCFLTRVYWDHAFEDVYPMGCSVFVSGGTWILRNTEPTGSALPNRGDVACTARCLVGPRPL